MYLLYVDESGDPGPNGSDFVLLGAAALFEGKWFHVEQEISDLINQYFPIPPRPNELHFAPLRQGKREYRSLTRAQRQSLLNTDQRGQGSLFWPESTMRPRGRQRVRRLPGEQITEA